MPIVRVIVAFGGHLFDAMILCILCRLVIAPAESQVHRGRRELSRRVLGPLGGQEGEKEKPLVYAALWVTVGSLIGERAGAMLGRHGGARLFLLIGPLALVTLIAYRLWRRRRYGAANPDVVRTESSCVDPTR